MQGPLYSCKLSFVTPLCESVLDWGNGFGNLDCVEKQVISAKSNQVLYHYNMKATALLKVAICHMPQWFMCSIIPPAGLVKSPLIRTQIPLIRLIYQGLFSGDKA